MIPLRDENPTRIVPFVTFGIIVANVAFFLYHLSLGLEIAVHHYGLIPAELLRGVDQIYTGARRGLPPGIGVSNLEPAWATVLTSMFSHGGWMHIIGNMWFLWIFGNNVEEAMGHGKYLAFYLLAGALAAGAQILTSLTGVDTIPMVGASGAVAGVLGAYLVLFPRSRVYCLVPIVFVLTTMELPAKVVLGFWFVLELVRGLTALGVERAGGVAYAAHVGGFIVGVVLGRLLGKVHPSAHEQQYAPRRDFPGEWR